MSISDEVLQKHLLAGKIASEVREEMKGTVREGALIIDLCEKAESLIRKKGGKPAFPCNVSVNEVAAHYTSPPADKGIIPKNSVVKIDIGVHVDGYIADTATTICFDSEYNDLVDTAEEALRKALEIIRPGLSVSSFGSTIQKTIKIRGFKPISNLTGHLIGRFTIHAGKSLPNVFSISASRMRVGEIYGVEPFVTISDAIGKVKSSKEAYIFRYLKHKSLKDPQAKSLLDYIRKEFQTLPFAERWLQDYLPSSRHKNPFSDLLSSKTLLPYPVFTEVSGKPVAQAEHTVLVVKEGCKVLT